MGFLGGGGGDDSRVSWLEMSQDDRNRIGTLLGGLVPNSNMATAAANNAINNTSTNFAQFNPNLNTNMGARLDAIGQGQVSQGLQGLAQQAAQRNAAITQQFAGRNPGLANVLRFQNQFTNQNAGNGLNFAALQSQMGREQANNAAALAQSQQVANLQQLANSAWSQKAQLGQQGLQNSALAAAAAAAGASALGRNYNIKYEPV